MIEKEQLVKILEYYNAIYGGKPKNIKKFEFDGTKKISYIIVQYKSEKICLILLESVKDKIYCIRNNTVFELKIRTNNIIENELFFVDRLTYPIVQLIEYFYNKVPKTKKYEYYCYFNDSIIVFTTNKHFLVVLKDGRKGRKFVVSLDKMKAVEI